MFFLFIMNNSLISLHETEDYYIIIDNEYFY